MRIHFVTGNPGKLEEAKAHLEPRGILVEAVKADLVEIQSDDLDVIARAKAEAARHLVEPPFLIEDAGLFIASLAGFPGPYSAHAYRTLGCDGILRLLLGRPDRTARFIAVAAFVEGPGPVRLFRGECAGTIATQLRGNAGFGFDPIFEPRGRTETFAELDAATKSKLSHRGKALDAVAAYVEDRARPARNG